MGKSEVLTILRGQFSSAFLERAALDRLSVVVAYTDGMPDFYAWCNPDRNGTWHDGRDWVQHVFAWARSQLHYGTATHVILGVDNPAYVPTAKHATQSARDAKTAPALDKDVVFRWDARMPPSAALLGDRVGKRRAIKWACAHARVACVPPPGKYLYVTGARDDEVAHPPSCYDFKGTRTTVSGLSPVGEAELRWVAAARQSRWAGTWLVRSRDTDALMIALLHCRELLAARDVYLDLGSCVVDLARLVAALDARFEGTGMDACQVAVAMSAAGNDFQTGWCKGVAHGSMWAGVSKHAAYIGALTDPLTRGARPNLRPAAMSRLIAAMFYERRLARKAHARALADIAPADGACAWTAVAAAVRAQGFPLPTDATTRANFYRCTWNVRYLWCGPDGPDAIPSAITARGWKRNAERRVLPREGEGVGGGGGGG